MTGTFPAGLSGWLYTCPVPVPSRFVAVGLAEALRAAGVEANVAALDAPVDLAALSPSYVSDAIMARPFGEFRNTTSPDRCEGEATT